MKSIPRTDDMSVDQILDAVLDGRTEERVARKLLGVTKSALEGLLRDRRVSRARDAQADQAAGDRGGAR